MILVGSGRPSMYKCTSTRILFPAKGNLVRKPLLQLLPHTFTGRAGCYVDWQQVLKCRMCSVYIFSFFLKPSCSLFFFLVLSQPHLGVLYRMAPRTYIHQPCLHRLEAC